MASCGCTGIEQIVITHWHHDHLGGVPSVQEKFGPDIPVRKYIPAQQETLTSGEGAVDPYLIWARERFLPLQDGEIVQTDGATLRVMFTPGHANDHVSLVLEEEASMFTADNVLGVGTAVFSDLRLYLDSLQRMQEAAVQLGKPRGAAGTQKVTLYTGHDPNMEDARPQVRFYTGHGPHIEDGVATLGDYIEHRMARVRQVEALLKFGSSGKGPGKAWTAEQVARVLYDGVPERLIPPATAMTTLVLKKLAGDGVVLMEKDENGIGAGLVTWAARM